MFTCCAVCPKCVSQKCKVRLYVDSKFVGRRKVMTVEFSNVFVVEGSKIISVTFHACQIAHTVPA